MAAGDGWVWKRSDAKYARSRRPWIARLDLGPGYDRGGRRRKRILREHACATQREAKDWLSREQAKLRVQGRAEGAVPLVGDLLEDWLRRGEVVEDWSPSHVRNSRWVARGLLRPLHHHAADELTVRDVRMLLHAELKRGRSVHTIRLARNALSAALNMAIADQLLPPGQNVAQRAGIPAVRRRPPKFLPPEALPDFLAVLEGCRVGSLYLVGMALALRPGEAVGLRWEDVDLERGTLRVGRSLQRVAGEGYVDRVPKADSYRTVHLPGRVAEVLRRHLKAQREERLRTRDWRDEGYVFTNRHGGPVHQPWANRHLRGLLDQVDVRRAEREGRKLEPEELVPRVTMYQLRHTGATLRLALGDPLAALQETMGHSSMAMTRRYAQVLEPALRASADRVDAFLAAAGDAAPDGTVDGTAAS